MGSSLTMIELPLLRVLGRVSPSISSGCISFTSSSVVKTASSTFSYLLLSLCKTRQQYCSSFVLLFELLWWEWWNQTSTTSSKLSRHGRIIKGDASIIVTPQPILCLKMKFVTMGKKKVNTSVGGSPSQEEEEVFFGIFPS